jgi:hypothetical protein
MEDRGLLSSLNSSLEQNQQEWKERARLAKAELQVAEDAYRRVRLD